MAMFLKVTSDMVAEPVSLTEMKQWLRVDTFVQSEDSLIIRMISSARQSLEKYTGCGFGVKSYEMIKDIDDEFMLPYGPLIMVNSVYKKTGINTWDLLVKNVDYEIIGDSIHVYSSGTYKVNYQAGFSTLPESLCADIKTVVSYMFENRGMKINDQGTIAYPYYNNLSARNYKRVVI